MRYFALVFVMFCCGCGSYFTGWGHDAASGALGAVTSQEAEQKLNALTTGAVKAARDEALGPATDADLQKLVRNMGTATRAQLDEMVQEVTATLQAKLREMLRGAIDEALGATTLKRVGGLREELAGSPLQRDLDALIDSASPHLTKAVQEAVQASIAPIKIEVSTLKTDADAEVAKWKPLAIGFAVGCGCLVICLIFGAFTLRSHRQIIEKLLCAKQGT